MGKEKPSVIESFDPQQVKIECVDSASTKEQLAELHKEIQYYVSDFEKILEIPVIHLGKFNIPVIPYDRLSEHVDKPKFAPEQYFNYVASLVETPQDIYEVINEPFMRWKREKEEFDPLKSPEVILRDGGGDCDNLSNVTKRLFDVLGCKVGHDFKARVIGIGTHALCIYYDQEGRMNAIDQDGHETGIASIYEASTLFKGHEEEIPYEIVYHRSDVHFQIHLDPKTLEDKKTLIISIVNGSYSPGVNPATYLPKGWEVYKKSQIIFSSGDAVFYEQGILHQEHLKDGNRRFYREGKLDQIQFSLGPIKLELYNRDGKLVERQYRDGSTEFFDVDTGNLREKIYTDGSREHFDPKSGVLVQKNFPLDHPVEAEVYYSDGKKVSERYFRSPEVGPNKIEWYDEQGKLVQVQLWDSTVHQVP